MGNTTSTPITQMSSEDVEKYMKKLQDQTNEVTQELKKTQDKMTEAAGPEKEYFMDFVECWNMNSLQKMWHSKRCKNATRHIGSTIYDQFKGNTNGESIEKANQLKEEMNKQISNLENAKNTEDSKQI